MTVLGGVGVLFVALFVANAVQALRGLEETPWWAGRSGWRRSRSSWPGRIVFALIWLVSAVALLRVVLA